MAEQTLLGPAMAHWRALAACVCVIAVPLLSAGWLNAWSLFAFPLGTFLVALGIPLGLIAAALISPRAAEDEASDT